MRIWDLAAGYLNRQSLLAEHRELHGLRSILVNGKKGYSRHPETLRWVGCLSGLARRHEALVAEMRLRGYVHRTPVAEQDRPSRWPATFLTDPGEQIALLGRKYEGKERGRIPLPRSVQDLWAGHKYSVMARDPSVCRDLGRRVAAMRRHTDPSRLARELVEILREAPERHRLDNALDHMWGHVRDAATADERSRARSCLGDRLEVIQQVAIRIAEPYLTASTALSELAAFMTGDA